MRHRFNERECARIEKWARETKLHSVLAFIERHPRKLEFPRPVLLGSNGSEEIFVEGVATRSSISSIIRRLDEPFNPHCTHTTTHGAEQQTVDLGAEINGTLSAHLRRGSGKVCFAKGRGGCAPLIVRSHLIQEALLRKIAINGHVMEINPFKLRGPEHEFRNWPSRIGVDEATTFTGFCSFHDHQLFDPIETGFFAATPEALFLYAYRALCSALYTCQYRFQMVKAVKAAVEAKQPQQNTSLASDITGNDLNTSELTDIKSRWDRVLDKRDFSACEHLVLRCPKLPDLCGAVFFAPTKDFIYRQVQNTKGSRALSWVAFTVVPSVDGGGVVMVSGERGNSVWRAFANSLLNYPPEKRATAVANYMICHFGEHLIFSSGWWSRLKKEEQEAVVNAWAAGYYPRYLKKLCDWGPLSEVTLTDS